MSVRLHALLSKYRVVPDLDIFVVPHFLRDVLGCDDAAFLQTELEDAYPIRRSGDAIIPHCVQWVEGENDALKYRGRALKRTKIWLQRGDPRSDGYLYYYYTGIQWRVVPAQTGWDQCPEVAALVPRYDAWCQKVGAQNANQVIVTAYRNGDANIGAHSDKARSIAASGEQTGLSLITVVKMGECGRPFELYRAGEDIPFWSQTVAPGTAVIMTMEANERTKHGVPVVSGGCGNSGSLVWRAITTRYTEDQVAAKILASEKARARSRATKRPRP